MLGDPITFAVLGQPLGQARPRFVRKTGAAYTDSKTRNNAAVLRAAAQEAMSGSSEPLGGPVKIEILAECQIPTSWSRVKQNAALLGMRSPSTRPDLSNIVKQIEDALNGVVFNDDRQITEIRCRKVYGVQPKIVVTATPL